MKYLIVLLLVSGFLNAYEYSSKIEPFEQYSVSSEYDANVVFVNRNMQYSQINKNTILVKLDSSLEDIELRGLQKRLEIQNNILEIKKRHYKNKFNIKQLSGYEKSNEKLQLLDAKQNIEELQRSINRLNNQKDKKIFSVNNRYLYEIFVHKGEYVQAGMKIFELYNLFKEKIVVYVKASHLADIKSKEVFVDAKKSDFVVEKVSKVVDAQRVSRYRVELYKKCDDFNKTEFGKVVKVEFR